MRPNPAKAAWPSPAMAPPSKVFTIRWTMVAASGAPARASRNTTY